jgi:hypothetical protein
MFLDLIICHRMPGDKSISVSCIQSYCGGWWLRHTKIKKCIAAGDFL